MPSIASDRAAVPEETRWRAFGLASLLGLAAVVALLAGPVDQMTAVLEPVTALTAEAASATIRWTGQEVSREGQEIRSASGFGFRITYTCTGLPPVVFMILAMSAYPTAPRRKAGAIAVVVPSLLLLNLVRLVVLFHVGVNRPDLFELAHGVVWDGLQGLVVLTVWIAWTTSVGTTSAAQRSAAS